MDKKDAKHLSEVLKAYADGKTIERHEFVYSHNANYDEWKPVTKENIDDSLAHYELRIKPELKLRAYKNGEEFFEAQKKHGVTVKDSKTWYNIASFNQFGVYLSIGKCYDYVDFLRFYKWADDESPCGIEEIK